MCRLLSSPRQPTKSLSGLQTRALDSKPTHRFQKHLSSMSHSTQPLTTGAYDSTNNAAPLMQTQGTTSAGAAGVDAVPPSRVADHPYPNVPDTTAGQQGKCFFLKHTCGPVTDSVRRVAATAPGTGTEESKISFKDQVGVIHFACRQMELSAVWNRPTGTPRRLPGPCSETSTRSSKGRRCFGARPPRPMSRTARSDRAVTKESCSDKAKEGWHNRQKQS